MVTKHQEISKPSDDFTASIMLQLDTETRPIQKLVSYDLNELLYILLALAVTIVSVLIFMIPKFQIIDFSRFEGTRWIIVAQFFQTALSITRQFFENIHISPLVIAILMATVTIFIIDRIIRRKEISKSFMII